MQTDWWHLDGADTCSLFSTWMARLLEEHDEEGHSKTSSSKAPVMRKGLQSGEQRTGVDQDNQRSFGTKVHQARDRGKLIAVTQQLHPVAAPGGSTEQEWNDLYANLPQEVQALMNAIVDTYGGNSRSQDDPGTSNLTHSQPALILLVCIAAHALASQAT